MAKGKELSTRYTPIRRKLVFHLMGIIAVIAVLILPIELYRPIDKLNQLVENSKSLISGAAAALDPGQLDRMNQFVLRVIPLTYEDEEMGDYLFVSFTMLILEDGLVSVEEVQSALAEEGNEIENFDYRRLEKAAAFWIRQFSDDPGIREIFVKSKKTLLKTKRFAEETDFAMADIYIMLDIGRQEGQFENNIAFVLDGYNWWEEPSYPGELSDVSGTSFLRTASLAGKSIFGNNPKHDKDNFFLPRFTVDEWGTWFSVWRTIEIEGVFNIVTIDFDASSVKETLFTVLLFVLGFFFLSLLLVLAVANMLANTFTRPITELTKGSLQIAEGNYDYQVPVFKDDELGELTRNFNAMARDQKERLNLKSTLEKLLSKELAETAGKHGLVLGGKRCEATLMFTDFAGFSTISQRMSPSVAVALLNTYFEVLVPLIKDNGGFPDKYIGDAIVAIFGAPIEFDDHADRALRCAIQMQQAMRKLNRSRIKQGKPIFEMRIGINSGDVTVGAIGCDAKLEYTSIGETTNLANRMESVCEIGHIMLGSGTYKQLDRTRFRDGVVIEDKPLEVMVKGYVNPVKAYRVFIDNLRIDKREGGGQVARFYRYSLVESKE